MTKAVIVVPRSASSKTGKVAATYAPIQSCPKDCPFLDGACYAQHGNCRYHLERINRAATKEKKIRPIDIARLEAKAIRELDSDLPLRLHIVGDCSTPRAAKILSDAAESYIQKTGQSVWTYTHAWKSIPRDKWGEISVLASCETIEESKYAMARGYAPSMVRLKPFNNSFSYKGLRMTPCKEMTKGIKCDSCKLCFNDKQLLKQRRAICFFPHGVGSKKAKDAIRRKGNLHPISDGKSYNMRFKEELSSGEFWRR